MHNVFAMLLNKSFSSMLIFWYKIAASANRLIYHGSTITSATMKIETAKSTLKCLFSKKQTKCQAAVSEAAIHTHCFTTYFNHMQALTLPRCFLSCINPASLSKVRNLAYCSWSNCLWKTSWSGTNMASVLLEINDRSNGLSFGTVETPLNMHRNMV